MGNSSGREIEDRVQAIRRFQGVDYVHYQLTHMTLILKTKNRNFLQIQNTVNKNKVYRFIYHYDHRVDKFIIDTVTRAKSHRFAAYLIEVNEVARKDLGYYKLSFDGRDDEFYLPKTCKLEVETLELKILYNVQCHAVCKGVFVIDRLSHKIPKDLEIL